MVSRAALERMAELSLTAPHWGEQAQGVGVTQLVTGSRGHIHRNNYMCKEEEGNMTQNQETGRLLIFHSLSHRSGQGCNT
jgi:hypothetical protein